MTRREKNDAISTFAVLAKFLAPLAVKPSSGREIINRKDRNGGAKFARYKSTQPAVSSLHHDHHNNHINHSSDNISSRLEVGCYHLILKGQSPVR